jgi:hypothetical protein
MGLGDSVTALLDTYSNCLKLLKAFKHHDHRNGSTESLVLRKSIKSDRDLVRRAYSSRRSETGRRFVKGDSEDLPVTLPARVKRILTGGRAGEVRPPKGTPSSEGCYHRNPEL